ncbi:unnamed protein product [Schistosoma margrebowiei]|uniref:Uncharacterized protein n=1 Tax=Schistosoma margrebowiei TaxID=48269 RepID=A0A183NAQ6_9TREM|nr:unnamed protein product [Schistosoma margrebowiei]
MAEPTETYVPANITRLGHHDRQARPPRQGSSFGRGNIIGELKSNGRKLHLNRPKGVLILVTIGKDWSKKI